jgi:organic hydroperoxide reductase OsmC/OhrA
MEPEKGHHVLIRVTATDGVARVQTEGLELLAGPSQPEGRGQWWFAEELLVAALSRSLLEAVHDEAHKAALPVGLFTCVGEAIVHPSKANPLGRLILRISIEAAASDVPRLDALVRRATQACVLARALAVPLEVQLTPLPSSATFSGEARSH